MLMRPPFAFRGARITEFIADKQLRLRSYIRRRPIPFKRMTEMDAACGTKSFLVQYCPDFDECLYSRQVSNTLRKSWQYRAL